MNKYSDLGKLLEKSKNQIIHNGDDHTGSNKPIFKRLFNKNTRLIVGAVGLVLVIIGLNLMQNAGLHLSTRFFGLVLFGSGTLIGINLIVAIGLPVIEFITNIFNRKRIRKKQRKNELKRYGGYEDLL